MLRAILTHITLSLFFDSGSAFIKTGFAGDDSPIEHRFCAFPGNDGIVTDWDERERQWHQCLSSRGLTNNNYGFRDRNTGSEAYSIEELHRYEVCMGRHALDPVGATERTLQYFFETCDVRAFSLQPATTLALYSSGRVTGLVVSAGHSTTSVGAAYEGYHIPVLRREALGCLDAFQLLHECNPGMVFPCRDEAVTLESLGPSLYPRYRDVALERYGLPDGHAITW